MSKNTVKPIDWECPYQETANKHGHCSDLAQNHVEANIYDLSNNRITRNKLREFVLDNQH